MVSTHGSLSLFASDDGGMEHEWRATREKKENCGKRKLIFYENCFRVESGEMWKLSRVCSTLGGSRIQLNLKKCSVDLCQESRRESRVGNIFAPCTEAGKAGNLKSNHITLKSSLLLRFSRSFHFISRWWRTAVHFQLIKCVLMVLKNVEVSSLALDSHKKR